jgi:hypothetical protein
MHSKNRGCRRWHVGEVCCNLEDGQHPRMEKGEHLTSSGPPYAFFKTSSHYCLLSVPAEAEGSSGAEGIWRYFGRSSRLGGGQVDSSRRTYAGLQLKTQ